MSQRSLIIPITRMIVVLGFIALAVFFYYQYYDGADWSEIEDDLSEVVINTDSLIQANADSLKTLYELDNFYPISEEDQLVEHRFYSLSYSEKDEQAKWVAYKLDKEQVNSHVAERTDDFRADPKVNTGSAALRDYRGSGYDRGHLCPAGDMDFSRLAMSESFFLSNMSPQHRSFNRGIWKELEEQTRDWVRANKELYIVTGPVLRKREREKIGENNVTVPRSYYKVLLDLSEPEQKAIAFVIPNARQTKRLEDFAITIDQLEEMTAIDFFPSLPDKQERILESSINPYRWIYNEERYQMRLSKWNYQ